MDPSRGKGAALYQCGVGQSSPGPTALPCAWLFLQSAQPGLCPYELLRPSYP